MSEKASEVWIHVCRPVRTSRILKNVGWWFQVVPVGYHVDGFRCQLFINFKAHLKEAMVAYSESVGCFKCSHLRDQLFLETWHGDEAN